MEEGDATLTHWLLTQLAPIASSQQRMKEYFWHILKRNSRNKSFFSLIMAGKVCDMCLSLTNQSRFWRANNKLTIHRVVGTHKISTARKEQVRGRHFFPQIEPNWPLRYSTVPGCQVGGCQILHYMREYNAESPKGKGSFLLWRRFTLPIFLLFIYVGTPLMKRKI